MIDAVRRAPRRRCVAGGSVSLLGALLLGVPVFDIWDDAVNRSWSVLATVAENAPFLILAGLLVWGGIWLVRTDWETDRVTAVARRTVVVAVVVGGLLGWAGFLQLRVMGTLKPVVLAMDGVLVGVATSLGLSLAVTRVEAADGTRQSRPEDLERLYRVASTLEATTNRELAAEASEHALRDLLDGAPFRVVVDGSVVAEHEAVESARPAEHVSIGDRGRIDLWEGPFERHELLVVELFATHLDEVIRRIDRETRLRKERDILAFVNRTLRHDLLGDLSLVDARLRLLDRNVSFDDAADADHLAVALGRVDEMTEFVERMRTSAASLLDEEETLDAVPLCPTLEERLDALEAANPDASVVRGTVPEVAVEADDLLGNVFTNLLRNAVEHNDASTPEVVLDADLLDDVVRIRIADNGPGIPAERRASVFEADDRSTERRGGEFGLSLVKDAVENYGGAIRIRDNDPCGTVFELDLPIASR